MRLFVHIHLFFICMFQVVPTTALGAEWPARSQRDTAARTMELGESAPDWLVQSETYAMGLVSSSWEALAASKVAFVTHCPTSREYFNRVHALGIRAFPYVTFYQGFASQTYQGVNLKDHPEFIEIDDQGGLKRTGFWDSEDAKNMYTICPAVPEYQEMMVAWVRKIMELGADGVFVDNISPRTPCFGPKFGKHKHLDDDPNHAFAQILKRVRKVVKEYKPDGAVLGNSGIPLSLPHEFLRHLDADMLESYICTWVSTERWHDWDKNWHAWGIKLQPLMAAGKQIQALSYLGHTPYGVREDGFFCYASARLAGFIWNGGRPLSDPDTAILYQIRLGPPLAPEQEQSGLHYRLFERGFVVVNPDKAKPGVLKLPAEVPTNQLYDLFGNRPEHWGGHGGETYLEHASPHGGIRCIKLVNATEKQANDIYQAVTLNQTEPRDLIVSGWSRAQGVSGEPNSNYAVYLDLVYADGTPLHGQIATFPCGSHDWQQQTLTIRPTKPVKSLTFYAMFRQHVGTAWFDDLSLKEMQGTSAGPELLRNPGIETVQQGGNSIDVSAKDRRLDIPAYSGRVYLYSCSGGNDLYTPGPMLTVVTEPALGEVRFRVDGFNYWTFSGSWGTEYTLGPNFGKFYITLDRPGRHTIEIVDVVPAEMKTPAGYGSGERLGQLMDPSQPTKPSGGKKFRFREWSGAASGQDHRVELDVKQATILQARFDTENPKPQ